jgi:hypothetical protein
LRVRSILTKGSPTGRYRVPVEPRSWRTGFISRADVADFLIKQIDDDTYLGKTRSGTSRAVTGVEAEGGPAPPTPENVAAVMELYPVGERFFQEFTLRQVLLNAAKTSRSAREFCDRPA